VEYVALHLALFELVRVPCQCMFDPNPFVMETFDYNFGVFSKFWKLLAALSNHLHTAPYQI